MKSKNLVFCIMLLMVVIFTVLNGCKNALEPPEMPVLSSSEVLLEDYTNYAYTEQGGKIITAFVWYFFYLENPSSFNDIEYIQIINAENRVLQIAKDKLRWDETNKVFDTQLVYDSNRPNSLALGTYSLKIALTDGSESTTSFAVYSRGNKANTAGFVYSAATSSTPKILANPTNCSATRNGNSLTINFTCNDEIITDAYVWFYDATGKYLGYSPRFNKNGDLKPTGSNTYTIDVGAVPNLSAIRVACESDNTPGNEGTVYRSRSPLVSVTY